MDYEGKLPEDFERSSDYVCYVTQVDKDNNPVPEGLEGFLLTHTPPRFGQWVDIADRWYIIRKIRPSQPPPPLRDEEGNIEEYSETQHCEISVLELSRKGKPIFLRKELLKTAHERILPGI